MAFLRRHFMAYSSREMNSQHIFRHSLFRQNWHGYMRYDKLTCFTGSTVSKAIFCEIEITPAHGCRHIREGQERALLSVRAEKLICRHTHRPHHLHTYTHQWYTCKHIVIWINNVWVNWLKFDCDSFIAVFVSFPNCDWLNGWLVNWWIVVEFFERLKNDWWIDFGWLFD